MKEKNRSRKRKRINKKKLLLVFIVLALLIFLIFKLAIGIKGIVKSKEKESLPVKSEQDINQEEKKIINIMIDPAKGGSNAGMSNPNKTMSEKEINLDIAKKMQAYILKHKDVRVMLTREYDDDKSLKSRADLAKENETDIFVSIRLNAQGSSDQAEGLDTYYIAPKAKVLKSSNKSQKKEDKGSESDKNDESSSKLEKTDKNKSEDERSDKESAEKESLDKESSDEVSSDKKSSDKESSNEDSSEKQTVIKRKNLSEGLAKSIQSTTLSFVEMKDRGVIQNSFDILNYTEMPAVIVQCGFISNKKDAEKLSNEAFRQELADGISEGLLCFIDENRNEIIKDRVNYR